MAVKMEREIEISVPTCVSIQHYIRMHQQVDEILCLQTVCKTDRHRDRDRQLPGGGSLSWLFQMTRTLARLGASATCWMILYNESRRSYVSITAVKPVDLAGIRGNRGALNTACCKHTSIIISTITSTIITTTIPKTTTKYSRLFNLGEMSCFNQHNAVQWIWIPFRLQT